MFKSIQDAIKTLSTTKSAENYRQACEYIIEHKDELKQRVFINLPGGLSGNDDETWTKVKAGSEERCSCGNERVINPGVLRTVYEASTAGPVIVKAGDEVYIKPLGGDKTSALFQLSNKDGNFFFLEDPFAPLVLSADIFSSKGFTLEKLANLLPSQPTPPVMMTKIGDVAIPVFAINAVDLAEQTITLTADVDMEFFDPDAISDHKCN